MDDKSKKTAQSNKILKRRRVVRYFIDAAKEICNEQGLDGVTIRSVAERAGYNSATLYNYFDDINQLMAFTSIDLVSDWLSDLAIIAENPYYDEIETYLMGWKSFAKHSCDDPWGFSYIYGNENPDEIVKYFDEYYEIFPQQDGAISDVVRKMYSVKTEEEQERVMITPCVKAGFLDWQGAEDVYKLALFLHKALLWSQTKSSRPKTDHESYYTFMKYLLEYTQTKLKRPKNLMVILTDNEKYNIPKG